MSDATEERPSRERFYVQSDGNRTGWEVVKPDGRRIPVFTMKGDAIEFAAKLARDRWENDGVPTQLVIRRGDGTFEDERTYGNDPFPPKG